MSKQQKGQKKLQKVLRETAGRAGQFAGQTAEQVKDAAGKAKQAAVNAIDQNGNGEIDIEDIIILGLKTPGIRINRSQFLQKELFTKYPQEVIDDAITFNPAHAQIPLAEIDQIADEVIKFERNCVSGISAALGIPGGIAMAATFAADLAQYYGYMLRAAQKLLYLYGFPELDVAEKGGAIDAETMNTLIICLGVMYGVAGANKALKIMSAALGKGVEKKLLNKALTKGVIYPIVKDIAKWFNVRMTKEIFAEFFKKAIPVAGGIIGGGITFFSFKPCCGRLKASLRNTILSNPDNRAGEGKVIVVEDFEDLDAQK